MTIARDILPRLPETPPVPHILPHELREILDLLAHAPSTVGRAYAMHDLIDSLLRLANQPHPISAIVPAESDKDFQPQPGVSGPSEPASPEEGPFFDPAGRPA